MKGGLKSIEMRRKGVDPGGFWLGVSAFHRKDPGGAGSRRESQGGGLQ